MRWLPYPLFLRALKPGHPPELPCSSATAPRRPTAPAPPEDEAQWVPLRGQFRNHSEKQPAGLNGGGQKLGYLTPRPICCRYRLGWSVGGDLYSTRKGPAPLLPSGWELALSRCVQGCRWRRAPGAHRVPKQVFLSTLRQPSLSPRPSLPLKSIPWSTWLHPGHSLSHPGGEIRKRLVELWLLILAKTKSPLRTALLESVDSNWHLRSTEMKPEEDGAARESAEVSVFWQPESEERGVGVRDGVCC